MTVRKGVKVIEILIFSDSHGNLLPMRQVLLAHGTASYVLFCGDGVRDVERLADEFPTKIFLSVKGNCDLFVSEEDAPQERLFRLGGHCILMTHGHVYGVKGGYGVAAAHAAKEGAEILVFGHTHVPFEGSIETSYGSIKIFNPGSIGHTLDGGYSYGVLTIRDNGYLLSHGVQPR